MKVIAVGSQKGGVGKTTTAFYVAAHAARRLGGQSRVAIIDRDESRNLTQLARLLKSLPPGVELIEGTEVPPDDGRYGMVVVDTPPGVTAIRSLAEANLVLVPVQPEPQGIANLADFLRNIDNQGRTVSPGMRLLALLPTRVSRKSNVHRHHIGLVHRIAETRRPQLAVLPSVRELEAIKRYELDVPDYLTVVEEILNRVYSQQELLGTVV